MTVTAQPRNEDDRIIVRLFPAAPRRKLGLVSTSFPAVAVAQATPDQSTTTDSQDAPATLPPAKFFYSTQYQIGKVGGYLVNPSTGELSSTGQNPVWAHWGPTKIASDSGGYRLYVANQGSQDISAFFIYRNNGWLYPVPGTNFPVGGVSTDIAVHPSNKFVYVTTTDNYAGEIKGKSNSVSAFSVASNGSLVAVKGSPFITSGPNWGIAIDPNGKYLYASSQVSDQNSNGEINAFSINQTTGAPRSPVLRSQSFRTPALVAISPRISTGWRLIIPVRS